MIPAGVFLFAFEAALLGGFAFEDIEAHVPKDGEVFRGAATSHAALVFGETHIQ